MSRQQSWYLRSSEKGGLRSIVLALAVAAASGCASPPQTILPEQMPYPIGDVYLPVYPTDVPYSIRMTVRAFVTSDGSVVSATFSPRSGNSTWDSLASAAIRQWRFEPARQAGRPVPAWVQFPVTLRFSEPQPILLSEIDLPTRSLADSVYRMLSAGSDFGAMAARFSTGPTAADSGRLGFRRLKEFPLSIQMAITAVRPGDITPPIATRTGFVIYKRMEAAAVTERP